MPHDPTMGYPDLLNVQSRVYESQSSFSGTFDGRTLEATPNPDDLIETEQSEIQETFEAKTKQFLKFTDLLGNNHEKETKADKFTNIVLNIQNESDFYKSWENAFYDEVQGYESDQGPVTAQKSTLIDHLPKVLCFQLNRLEYDRNRQQMTKKNHPFPIKTTIYPDRFLYKNKDEVDKLREEVAVTGKKIQYLRQCLAKYDCYNGGDQSIEKLFKQMIHFYGSQGQETEIQTTLSQTELSDLKVHQPLQQTMN